MRDKINSAVADVREEVANGRLAWVSSDVARLIQPHPRHRADAVLARIGDDTAIPLGEKPYHEKTTTTTATTAAARTPAKILKHPQLRMVQEHPRMTK